MKFDYNTISSLKFIQDLMTYYDPLAPSIEATRF